MSTQYPTAASWNYDYYGEGNNIVVDRWANIKGFTFNSTQVGGAVVKLIAGTVVDTPGTGDVAEFGVVLQATASGAHGAVVTHGQVRGVVASGAITAGQKCITAGAPVGSVSGTSSPTVGQVVGIAITGATATGQTIVMYVGKD